jgi:hypothetical protein
MQYMSLYESIDVGSLKDEVIDYEERIKEKIFRNDDEKELSRLLRDSGVLKDLVEIKLTTKSLDYYRSHKAEFSEAGFDDFIRKEYSRFKLTYPKG